MHARRMTIGGNSDNNASTTLILPLYRNGNALRSQATTVVRQTNKDRNNTDDNYCEKKKSY